MIGLHEELQQREASGRPVRVGLIGAGQMGTDVVATTSVMQGVRVVVTRGHRPRARTRQPIASARSRARSWWPSRPREADAAVAAGKLVAVRDFRIVTDMRSIDVMLESTGVPEIGALAALRSARSGHDLAMMNVETDITVGPILNWYARQKGVLYALAAGDEPAACKELYDLAVSMGFTIVAAGKGKNNPLDRHATPADPAVQKEAARRGLSPNMLIEFVDGSKTMIEMAAVSNATGLVPDVRGMHGPETDRDHLAETFCLQSRTAACSSRTGVVDYGIGQVAPGVFLIVRTDHPRLREAMVLRDMGDGPYYTLFRPFHLCSIEVPLTCAMLAIRQAVEHGAAGPAGLGGLRRRQARPGRGRHARCHRRHDLLQPHRHVRGAPRPRACCPSAWPRALGSCSAVGHGHAHHHRGRRDRAVHRLPAAPAAGAVVRGRHQRARLLAAVDRLGTD